MKSELSISDIQKNTKALSDLCFCHRALGGYKFRKRLQMTDKEIGAYIEQTTAWMHLAVIRMMAATAVATKHGLLDEVEATVGETLATLERREKPRANFQPTEGSMVEQLSKAADMRESAGQDSEGDE